MRQFQQQASLLVSDEPRVLTFPHILTSADTQKTNSEKGSPSHLACLGFMDGSVELKIPAGTQPGTTLLMSKRGVPRLGNPNLRGDHLVKVNVKIPQKLTPEERKKFEELREISSQEVKA